MFVAPDPGAGRVPMRGPRPLWLVAALGVSLLALAVGAGALQRVGPGLDSGGSHYVQVVHSGDAEVVAGQVTETATGPLGLREETRPAREGWVLVHPPGLDPDAPAHVREEIPFQDPNGGSWMEREVRVDNATAWAVPVGPSLHDDTLDADYNFAVVVEWDEVEGDELETTYLESIELVGDDG